MIEIKKENRDWFIEDEGYDYCIVCGEPTSKISIEFHAHICSYECELQGHEEMEEVIRDLKEIFSDAELENLDEFFGKDEED